MLRSSQAILLLPLALGLAGCGSFASKREGFADPGAGAKGGLAANAGVGVNAYLWRAALDTLSFMPLASEDPFGGVISTDWFQPPSSSNERFRATAYILGRGLRADALRVAIFRQVEQNGQWVDASVSKTTTGDIENKILARARELRTDALAHGVAEPF